jgi:hypothetical protein
MEWYIILFLFLLACGLAFLAFYLSIRNRVIPSTNTDTKRITDLESELVDVKKLLEYERSQRDKDNRERTEEIIEAFRKIKKQEETITQLKSRIQELESTNQSYGLPITPLLLVCGDHIFCEKDAAQLNRAKIWYRTLEDVTKLTIEEELHRRRQNSDLYPYVHISAHGTSEGILLQDGIASPEWWNNTLEGIRVAFFANCNSIKVGDALAGLVDYVVVFYGDRNSDLIERFTYTFWSEIMRTNDPMKAYNSCLRENPALRRYSDIRTR